MDFRQLKYFTMVAEAKSFTRAAEILRLAQPALSNQMQKLEDELQEQLLIRHSRGIELTEAGRRLLVHARAILHQLNVAREDLRGGRGQPEGLVRIGMPRSVLEMIAVGLIRESARRMPSVSIRVIEQFSESIYGLLLERELDIGLTYSIETSGRVTSEMVLSQRLSLVSHPSAKFPSKKEVEFAELSQLPLILGSPTHSVRKLLELTAAEEVAGLHVVHEVDSLQTTLNMIEAGLGHTVLPPTVVAGAVRPNAVAVRMIKNPELVRRLHIARPTHAVPTRAQLAVYQLLTELFQQQKEAKALARER